MPISSDIDQENKMIYSYCSGVMKEEDFDEYLKAIWVHSEYYGFNELFDITQGNWEEFDYGCLFELAQKSAKLNLSPQSKLACYVHEGKQKQLVDFYMTAKTLATKNSRKIDVFYSKDEALKWLESE